MMQQANYLESLPDWSKTIDPSYVPDYKYLQSAAISFLDAMPQLGALYCLDHAVLSELRAHGVEASILSMLAGATCEEQPATEFKETVKNTIGQDSFESYQHEILICASSLRRPIRAYSKEYCERSFDLRKASGLYVFLRVIFSLPTLWPLEESRVFGGWMRPSAVPGADRAESGFDLSWPVWVDKSRGVLQIERFVDYFGRGYNAIGEFDYFAGNFELRTSSELADLTIR